MIDPQMRAATAVMDLPSSMWDWSSDDVLAVRQTVTNLLHWADIAESHLQERRRPTSWDRYVDQAVDVAEDLTPAFGMNVILPGPISDDTPVMPPVMTPTFIRLIAAYLVVPLVLCAWVVIR